MSPDGADDDDQAADGLVALVLAASRYLAACDRLRVMLEER